MGYLGWGRNCVCFISSRQRCIRKWKPCPPQSRVSNADFVKMVVVPKDLQLNPSNNVALLFFKSTFGTLSNDDDLPERILSAFMAISSFGNIVVMTFTAARGECRSKN